MFFYLELEDQGRDSTFRVCYTLMNNPYFTSYMAIVRNQNFMSVHTKIDNVLRVCLESLQPILP